MKPSRSILVLSAAFGLLCFGPILLPVLALLPLSLPFLALHLNKPKFASVFYGTSWTLAVLLCCALLAAVMPIWIAGVLTVFGLFFLSFGLAITRFRPKVPIGTAIFAPIVAIGLIFPAGRLSTLLLGEQVDQISVSEANAHPDAAWITFTDATLGVDHAYSRLVTWERKKHRSAGQRVDHIAPLIYPGWTPAQPVTAWAFCDSESHTCPDWNKSWDSVVSVDELKRPHTNGLVAEACRAYGLTSAANAPLLMRIESRATVLQEQILFALIAMGLAFGTCGLVLPLWPSRPESPRTPSKPRT
jgi:hypothetical protein